MGQTIPLSLSEVERALFTGLISHAFASLCLSSFHFLSSPLVSVSFKYDTKRKCQLCSIWLHPQDICQHIQTRRGGAVIPHSCSLLDHRPSEKKRSEEEKKKAKARFAPVRPVIPAIIPNCFTEVGRFLRWLRLGPSRGEYSATRILIKSRGVTAMHYCSFSCVGHCGVTHPDTVEPSAPHHLVHSGSCSDCTAGIPIYRPRSATVPGVCCARRKCHQAFCGGRMRHRFI